MLMIPRPLTEELLVMDEEEETSFRIVPDGVGHKLRMRRTRELPNGEVMQTEKLLSFGELRTQMPDLVLSEIAHNQEVELRCPEDR